MLVVPDEAGLHPRGRPGTFVTAVKGGSLPGA